MPKFILMAMLIFFASSAGAQPADRVFHLVNVQSPQAR
jgi:hypothetical protein